MGGQAVHDVEPHFEYRGLPFFHIRFGVTEFAVVLRQGVEQNLGGVR